MKKLITGMISMCEILIFHLDALCYTSCINIISKRFHGPLTFTNTIRIKIIVRSTLNAHRRIAAPHAFHWTS